jgi:hypothetical protein
MTGPQDPFATPSGDPSQPAAGYGQQSPPPAYGQQPAYGQPGDGRSMKNGLGTAALVLGVLSLLTWFFLIGGLLGVAAIVLGVMALARVKRGEASNRGMALTGIITGVLGVLLTILVIAGVAALFNSGDFGSLNECLQEAGNDQSAIDDCSRQFEDSLR